ncbi:MAG: hypothetical protein DMF90_23760 [Acidobacteria bacterium]|nr:MAG: hypothetical protein DMF90_23760 [Acidobacteriota bacterium]
MFGVYPKNVHVIPSPTPKLPCGEYADQGDPWIFYPARLWPHKNRVVVLAAPKVRSAVYGIKLQCVLTGPDEGNLSYLLRFAYELGIKDQIDYQGLVSDEQLACLYKRAFPLVYASAVGPDNLPPLEAMSLGCPVITADVPGAREQYGDAALFFEPTDECALADRIKTLLSEEVTRERLVHAGQQREARWTVEDFANAILSIYDESASVARAWDRCDSAFT